MAKSKSKKTLEVLNIPGESEMLRKQESVGRFMDFQKVGLYLICISPLLSVFAVWLAFSRMIGVVLYFHDWLTPLIVMTLANASVNGLQVFGLTIYLEGYRRNRKKLTRSLFTKPIAIS